MVERAAHLALRKNFLLACDAGIARELVQPLAHAQALGKELAVLRVAKERDGHALRAPQQDTQNAQLTPRKIRKTVEENVFIVNIPRRFEVFLQLFEHVARVVSRRVELAEVNAVDERKVAQLVAALTLDLRYALG